jgi:predicted unusual protein kinase regulating ubiquinone biosynthesis (AarF/ABC1/UbiB family)
MERLHGTPLSAVVRDATGPAGVAGVAPATLAAAREGVAALLKSYGQQIFDDGLFHADPHPGNMLLLAGGDGGEREEREGGEEGGGRNEHTTHTLPLFPTPCSPRRPAGPAGLWPGQSLERQAAGELDRGEIERERKGKSRPHPTTKNSPPPPPSTSQRLLADVVIAIDDGDPDAVATALADMGLCPPPGAPGAPPPLLAAVLASVVFDTAPLPAASVNPLDDTGRSVLKLVPLAAFPSDLFQVGRTLMLLRGLTHALGMDVSSASLWRPAAEKARREPAGVAAAKAAAAKELDNGGDHADEDEE